eukprot:38098_1
MATAANKFSDALLQNEGQGWKIDLFVNENVKAEYVCYVCHNICKDAVELSCDIDHDDDNIQLYCQTCLSSVISSNNNQCPIDNHKNPKYTSIRRIRAKINKSKVLCPNSSMYQQRQLNKDYEKGNVVIDTLDEKEGLNNNNINVNDVKQKGCNFEGCLTDLIQHVAKCCETHLNSKEMQAELIKLLKKDIYELQKENKHIQNTLMLQNEVINQLKKANVNMNEKYEQQTIRIDELKNITRQQINNKTYEEQNKRIRKVETVIESQKLDIRFAEQNERIVKLENIIKAQNDLIASMITPKNEQKEVIVSDKWDPNAIGSNIQIDGKTVTKIKRDGHETAYLSNIVHAGVHHWTFLIDQFKKQGGWTMRIGVYFGDKMTYDGTYDKNCFCLLSYAGKLEIPCKAKYAKAFFEGDKVDMYLDLDEQTLSYSINDKYYGKACQVNKGPNYRAVIGIYEDGNKIKLLAYDHDKHP